MIHDITYQTGLQHGTAATRADRGRRPGCTDSHAQTPRTASLGTLNSAHSLSHPHINTVVYSTTTTIIIVIIFMLLLRYCNV